MCLRLDALINLPGTVYDNIKLFLILLQTDPESLSDYYRLKPILNLSFLLLSHLFDLTGMLNPSF